MHLKIPTFVLAVTIVLQVSTLAQSSCCQQNYCCSCGQCYPRKCICCNCYKMCPCNYCRTRHCSPCIPCSSVNCCSPRCCCCDSPCVTRNSMCCCPVCPPRRCQRCRVPVTNMMCQDKPNICTNPSTPTCSPPSQSSQRSPSTSPVECCMRRSNFMVNNQRQNRETQNNPLIMTGVTGPRYYLGATYQNQQTQPPQPQSITFTDINSSQNYRSIISPSQSPIIHRYIYYGDQSHFVGNSHYRLC